MELPKGLKPRWTTLVMPTEYDIEKELREVVKSANKAGESGQGMEGIYVIADIGKLVGLYLAYLETCDEILTLKIEADQNNEFAKPE